MQEERTNPMTEAGPSGADSEDLLTRAVLPRLEEIRGWTAAGASLRETARRLGISPRTLGRYRDRFPAVAGALASGAAPLGQPAQAAPMGFEADRLVEAALLKRACGYEYEETVTEEKYSKELGGMATFTKTTRKHMQPDAASIQFWLTNRRRDRWAQHPEPELAEDRDGTGVILLPMAEGAEGPGVSRDGPGRARTSVFAGGENLGAAGFTPAEQTSNPGLPMEPSASGSIGTAQHPEPETEDDRDGTGVILLPAVCEAEGHSL